MSRATCVPVHLVFPGVTEARLFPYLSLPMLVSYLRARGITADQTDLNIALTHRLNQPAVLNERLRRGELDGYEEALLTFAIDQHDLLWRTVIGKEQTGLSHDVAFRLVNNLMDIVLRGSALVPGVSSLADVLVHADGGGSADIAATQHDDLTRRMLMSRGDGVHGILGISVAFFSQLVPAFRLAQVAKRLAPNLTVILGGQQLMLHGAELAAMPGTFRCVDGLVTGPGEVVLEQASTALAEGRPLCEVPGLHTSAEPPTTGAPAHRLSRNPAPVFDGLPFAAYLAPEPQLPLISCVGCYWGRCVYCSYGNRSLGGRYQQLTAPALADHMVRGLEETGSRFVAFVDENCNLRLVLRAAELTRARGREFTWSTRNRLEPQLADRTFVERMYAAGCRLMSVGYETNSQRLLDLIDKGVRADQYETIIRLLDEVGIVLRLSVMGGLPDETEEEAADSRRFLVRNSHLFGIDAMQMMIAEPTSLLVADVGNQPRLSVQDGPALQSNDGFSYLSGRHGRVIDYDGATRDERAGWLAETMRTLLPGKNDEKHPRWKRRSAERLIAELALHPWVVVNGAESLVDLRWRMRYRIAPEHVECRAGVGPPRLVARTQTGRRLLGLMEEAEIGRS